MTDTNAQGIIDFTDGSAVHMYGISTGGVFTDGTEAEMYVRTVGGSQEQLWKSNSGKAISRIRIQVADGSFIATCKIYDPKNGVVAFWRGSERNITSVKNNEIYDINVGGLAIPVQKGTVLKLNTTD
jgi:PAS domain-containing protein